VAAPAAAGTAVAKPTAATPLPVSLSTDLRETGMYNPLGE
jgi:hypothetical protein